MILNILAFLAFVPISVLIYCICKPLKCILSKQDAFLSKIINVINLSVFCILCASLHQWGDTLDTVSKLGLWKCNEYLCDIELVYRVVMAYSIFYILLTIMTLGMHSADFGDRAKIQNEHWEVKIPVLFFLITLCLFVVPETVILHYAWINVIFAVIFIFVQLYYVVHFSFGINIIAHNVNTLDNKYNSNTNSEKNPWIFLVMIFTPILLIFSICLLLLEWELLKSHHTCYISVKILCLYGGSALLLLVFSFLNITRKELRFLGSFQFSVVFLFDTFLLWCATIVDDPEQCSIDMNQDFFIYTITVSIGSSVGILLYFYQTLPMAGLDQSCYNYGMTNFYCFLFVCYSSVLTTNWSLVYKLESFAYAFDYISSTDITTEIHHHSQEKVEFSFSLEKIPMICSCICMIVITIIYILASTSKFIMPRRFYKENPIMDAVLIPEEEEEDQICQ